MNEKGTIPCEQCPVLAICKNKSYIKCTILGTQFMRIAFGKGVRKNNLIFMDNAAKYLGCKEWTIFGNEARIYDPISEVEENRIWQSIGDRK